MKVRKLLGILVLAIMIVPIGMVQSSADSGSGIVNTIASPQTLTSGKISLAFDNTKNYTVHTTTPINLAEQFASNTYNDPSTIGVTSTGGITYRAYENIVYCAKPVNTAREVMNIYVPSDYYNDQDAPILFFIEGGGFQGQSLKYPSGMGQDNYKSIYIDEALKAGFVVVSVNFRGQMDVDSNGLFNGKAPAGLVDLKAAVRYLKYNDAVMPGSAKKIVSEGSSSGGCYSALVGSTANSPLYDSYLEQIGAITAEGIGDDVLGSAVYCPITDLDNADMAYEWEYGSLTTVQDRDYLTEMTDEQKAASAELAAMYTEYYKSLGIGDIADLKDHMINTYIIPSANEYLNKLSSDERDAYLSQNTWIIWDKVNSTVTAIDFESYIAYCGRNKTPYAFVREGGLFGTPTVASNYFTDYQKQFYSGDASATVSQGVLDLVYMMNPYNFVDNANSTNNWWIRVGTRDTHTSHTVSMNLAELLKKKGKNVSYKMSWDYPHDGDWYDYNELNNWITSICKN